MQTWSMALWKRVGLGLALFAIFLHSYDGAQRARTLAGSAVDFILQTPHETGEQNAVPSTKTSCQIASPRIDTHSSGVLKQPEEPAEVARSCERFERYTMHIVSPKCSGRLGLTWPIQLSMRIEGPSQVFVQEAKAVLKYGGRDNTVWEFEVPPLPNDNAQVVTLAKAEGNSSSVTFEAEVDGAKHGAGFVTVSFIAVLENDFHLERTTTIKIGDFESNLDLEQSRRLMHDKQSRSSDDTKKWRNAREAVANKYKPLHPQIRRFSSRHLSEDFWTQNITEIEDMPGVYIVPRVFSSEFLRLLNEELTYAQTQKNNWTRPNTMNNFGFMLSELGFDGYFDDFVTHVLDNLRARFLPAWGKLDSHHAFTIGYGVDEDKSLDRHMDLSEVTLNVCLEKAEGYTGTRVFFDGLRDNEKPRVFAPHLKNSALLHPGQFWHGAAPTEDESSSTNRRNLIVWGRSSSYRSSPLEHHLQEESHVSKVPIEKQTIGVESSPSR